jgi:hypothetical protein
VAAELHAYALGTRYFFKARFLASTPHASPVFVGHFHLDELLTVFCIDALIFCDSITMNTDDPRNGSVGGRTLTNKPRTSLALAKEHRHVTH